MIVSPTTFTRYTEYGFLDFLEEKSYLLVQGVEYMENPDANIPDFEAEFRYVAWMLDSRRDHNIEDTHPFFRGGFVWVVATEGPDNRITGVSLIRIPNKIDAIGDIIYFEANPSATPNELQELHDETSKVVGTWYEEMLPHHDIKAWKDSLNIPFLNRLRQGTLK